MITFWILCLFAVLFWNHHHVLGLDDENCKFAKSLKAKKEIKHLDLPANDRNEPRDFCSYWKISASRSDNIEVLVPAISLPQDDPCRDVYLKLEDDESEEVIDFRKQTENTKFVSEESEVKVYYKPGLCRRRDFRLSYRSLPESDRPVDDDDDDDNDEGKGTRIASIVGAVIGSLLALAVFGCAIFLVRKCSRRNRSSGAVIREDAMTVHFWSKESGYSHVTEMAPSSSTSDPHALNSSYRVTPQKPFGPQSRIPQGTDGASYNNTGPSPVSSVSPPAPPPYPGHEYDHPQPYQAMPTMFVPQSGDEPPPPYAYAVEKK